MAGPGGAEVGRVSIKVVPDFTHFRRDMLAELKKWDGREVTIKVKADKTGIQGITRDLNKAAKQSSKDMSREISKGLKSAVKDTPLTPAIGNKRRYQRRVQAQFDKLFKDVEVRLSYKDSPGSRKYWDNQEKNVRKQIAKINAEMSDLDFANQAEKIDELLLRLTKTKFNKTNPLDTPEYRAQWQQMRSDFDAGMRSIQRMKDETNRLSRAAQDATAKTDRLFQSFSNKDARQALREYVYNIRNMGIAVSRYISGDGTQRTDQINRLEKEISRVTSHADRLRMRGGLIGSLLGGAGAIAGAKQVLDGVARGVAGVGKAAAGAGEKITGLFKGLNPQGLGLNVSTAGFAVIAGLITLVAAPLAGLLTAAAMTIPGLLATVMAPIGAIVLGFKGIKDAATDAGLFGDKNGDKKGGGSLGKALTDLQEKVQTVFREGLREPFRQLGSVVSTWVEPLTTVAEGTVNIFGGMLQSITSEIGSTRIAETISAIGTELSRSFAPGIKSFSDALIGLAHEFTTGGALAGVGEWFKDTMADFSRFVEEGIRTGSLTETFKQLGETLKVVLDLIGGIAKSGLDFVKDPKAMDGFKQTLTDIADLIQKIADLSAKLGPLWDFLSFALPDQRKYTSELEKMNAEFEKAQGLKPGSLAALEEQDSKSGLRGWLASFGGTEVTNEMKVAGDAAGTAYVASVMSALSQNKDAQKELLRQAFSAEGVTDAAAAQIAQQAGIAINGARQALVPLKEGLQTDIDAALQPLGDIAGRVQSAFDAVPGLVQGSLGQIPGIVRAAMGNLGAEAETSMAGVSDAVIKHCAIAVNTANSEAPRIKAPFEALKDGMVAVGNQMMAGLAAGISSSVGFAEAAAGAAARRVKAAADAAAGIKSPSREFMKTGDYMMQGMQLGIQNGTAGPVAAMREVMQAIKDVFGSAEGLNINFFMGQAATSMSDMAASSKEFRSNMVEAGTTPALSSGLDSDLSDVKRQKAEIDLQIAQLQAQKNATQDKTAKAAIQGEMDQLRIQKERLDLLKEENGLQEDRKTAIQKLSDTIATNIVDMIKMPGEFAKATTNAAMQDLGISGSGAIPTIANWALDAGTNFIFNVNNMDDALQGQQAQQRKQVAGIAGR